MSDSRFIAALVLAFALAAASPSPGATPVSPPPPIVATDGTPQANARLIAPQPNRSAVDSELIHHGPDAGAASGNASAPGSPSLELFHVGAALAIVITLIFGLRWGGKKLFGSAMPGYSTRAIQVLARSPVSPRQSILLLRVGRRVIVVGDSAGQMNSLSEITDPDEVAALVGQLRDSHSSAGAFGKLFHRAANDMDVTEAESANLRDEPTDSSDAAASDGEIDPAIHETREELTGLMEKIRSLSRNFPTRPGLDRD